MILCICNDIVIIFVSIILKTIIILIIIITVYL